MDRFRRSVKLPITITHSWSHHRAVNKIISTTLGMNNRDRTPWSRPVPARVRRAATINHSNKEAPTSQINCQASYGFRKNALRTNRWLVNRHLSIGISQRYPVDGNSMSGYFKPTPPVSRAGPRHAADSEARFLLRSKSVGGKRYRLIRITIVTLSSDFVEVKVRRLPY